ncbi:hypothetical protein Scep_022255 [Stephania cephalantha]|uniref:Uncharacterized protein n=1 Tax=Stephania cephalantha TaxID=152367 RepID=A0AAP0F519_9MAGN
MMKKLLDDQQQFHEELQQFSREFPSLQNLENQFIQVNATLQNMLDEKELCNTQPISYSDENVSVDTLKNVEVNEVTQVENYWRETAEGLEVLQIEPEIIIAQDEDEENEMKIEVVSKRPDEPQKRERKTNLWYSFMLEIPNELTSLKEGVHDALPKAIDVPFIIDISKGEGIT